MNTVKVIMVAVAWNDGEPHLWAGRNFNLSSFRRITQGERARRAHEVMQRMNANSPDREWQEIPIRSCMRTQ